MNGKNESLKSSLLLAMLLLALAACLPATVPEPQATADATATQAEVTPVAPAGSTAPTISAAIPGAEPDTATPGGVVEAFYTWYLDPEREGEFDESPYLSRQIAAVTEARKGYIRADPFLLAQEQPAAIRVEEVAVGSETAQVVLHQYWNLEMEEGSSCDLTLDLVREEGQWKIDGIQRGSPLTPEGVVQLFYDWYFGEGEYDRSLGSAGYALAHSGNPLAERTFQDSPYLAPSFVAQVDEYLADVDSMSQKAEPYDPFLRAYNHPSGFFVQIQQVAREGDEATVPVQLMYGRRQTTIDVTVVREDDAWRIGGVQGELPDEATAAAQVAELFTDYYFSRWYTYAEGHGLPHTAGSVDLNEYLAESGDVYVESPFVSGTFAAAAQQKLAEDAAVDPFFLAPGVPAMIEVEEAWAEGDRAEVHVLQRWHEAHETRPLTVTLVREGGRWLIDGVIALAGEAVMPTPDPRAEMHPADVVRAFFGDYLAEGGFAAGAHHESPYLSPAYVDVVASDANYYRSLGMPVAQYDPILHSAAGVLGDLRVEVGEVAVDEAQHTALARATRIYGNGVSLSLSVMLARDWDNRWFIQEINAVDPAGLWAPGEDLSDEFWLALQVAAWYDWAVAYAEQPEQVQDLPQLMGFDMEAEGGITFCSASWPQGFAVESAFIEPDVARGTRRASVVLRTSVEHALLTLALEEREWRWVILDQWCGDTPEGRARAFYTEYLGYQGDPLSERVYAGGDYLTQDLIMAVHEAAVEASGGVDPFILATEQPQWFDVRPGTDTNDALVTLDFAGGARHELRLTFVLVDGRWLLSDVEQAG